jgi:hypothetical protein
MQWKLLGRDQPGEKVKPRARREMNSLVSLPGNDGDIDAKISPWRRESLRAKV